MKSSWFVVIIAVIFSIYAGVNYYIGYRGWQAFVHKYQLINSRLYWMIFWIIALAYIIARLTQKFLPKLLAEGLTLVGSYWMAAMVYFIIILLTIDAVRLLDKWVSFIPDNTKNNPFAIMITGLFIIGIVTCILVYGTWNARNPVVKHYEVNINKKAGSIEGLHAVMVSDIHLGNLIHNDRLTKMVDEINKLNPDIILLPGDVIDEDIEVVIEENMAETFKQLNSKLGTYAVFGNHENIGGQGKKVAEYLEAGGINVLKDSFVKVNNSFYVVGRNDMSSRGPENTRKNLNELIKGIDKSLPIILLDHQPSKLEEPKEQGVDLQLSGHTHKGQFFPIQLITNKIYERDYGYLRKGDFQLIVSSGYGTWGPPIRVGNKPEIVDIVINFKNNSKP